MNEGDTMKLKLMGLSVVAGLFLFAACYVTDRNATVCWNRALNNYATVLDGMAP